MMFVKNVFFTIEDKAKYPFSIDTINYIRELGFGINDLKGEYGRKILRRASKRIISAIERRNIDVKLNEPDIEILSFPTSLLLVKILNDQFLLHIYSIAESKRAGNLLKEETSEKILYIALNTFNLRVKLINNGPYVFMIHFKDYLKNLPEIHGAWSLVNRKISHGMVYISKNEMARLVEEAIKVWIVKKVENMDVENDIEESFAQINYVLNEIRNTWKKYREKYYPTFSISDKDLSTIFPPCIAFLIDKVKAGKNLSHSERFAVATFLLSIGKSVDYVINLFRYMPDYNEEITRYQVEHLAGLRGSRTKYVTFNCNNMRILNICKETSLCRNIKHPLQYYYRYGLKKHVARKGISKKSI